MTSPRVVESEKHLAKQSLLLGMIGWIMYDWATNSFPTIVETFLFAGYFTGQVAPSETAGTTWWGLTLGITGLLIAVAAPLLGSLLVQLGRRKPWIASLTLVTVVAAALMWFWVFAMVLGVFIGPAQAGSRSYLARVALEKLHNQLFGLYTLSGKAVAFLGPLLVGGLTYLTQSQRIGMSGVVGLIFLGFLVWLTVPGEDQVAK